MMIRQRGAKAIKRTAEVELVDGRFELVYGSNRGSISPVPSRILGGLGFVGLQGAAMDMNSKVKKGMYRPQTHPNVPLEIRADRESTPAILLGTLVRYGRGKRDSVGWAETGEQLAQLTFSPGVDRHVGLKR